MPSFDAFICDVCLYVYDCLRLIYSGISDKDSAPGHLIGKHWMGYVPEQTVQAFEQTADGYLWIGTTGGLLRFDGARFTVFDVEHTPQLQDNGVFALLTSRDGSLWIGTEGGGLVRYKYGIFRAYGSRDGLSDGFVRTIYEDRSGTIGWEPTADSCISWATDWSV